MTTATAYEPVIGLEVHVQLQTATKLFCRCRVAFGAPANSLTCPVCIGLPGALPVANREVISYGIRVGLALGSKISPTIKFDRKNYFYPDLPKGYQISQYDNPLCNGGQIKLANGKVCGITRAHLEEDAGKSIHMDTASLVDLNRSGTALLEIVGEPDLRSPDEAYEYLTILKRNLGYLGVSDLSMEKGSLRVDANVSIRPVGQEEFGVRSEIKNLNSFRAVRSAIEFEIKRHAEVLDAGESLSQDTRLWDDERLETRPLRSKEQAVDYRFFPEPDLTQFDVSDEWVESVRASLPEMPDTRMARFIDDYGLAENDAEYLTGDRELADYFEAAAKLHGKAKTVSAWVLGEVSRELSDQKVSVTELTVTAERLVGLIALLDAGKLNNITAKEVFREMVTSSDDAETCARRLNKLIEQDDGAVDAVIDEVFAEFADAAVADLKAGKEKALGFLIGQCMRKLRGKANPKDLGAKIQARVKND